MIASELISQILSPLRTSDTGEQALAMMSIYHVKHLPIVNSEELLGTISEEDILSANMDEPIGSYGLSLSRAHVNQHDHLFEVMGKMAEFKLTAIPVVDDEKKYLGVITQEELMQFYARSFSFSEPGSILVLEMENRDYSLAEISRIIEGEQIKILSTFLTKSPDSNVVYVTLKISSGDSQRAKATLERHDYFVKASFVEETYVEDLNEHYDALMHYLNV
jgi:acetoin utilization protein AcuB